MMDKTEFRDLAIQRRKDCTEHCQRWHNTARDDYAFIAGDQWEPDDQELLELQNRPMVTFNYSEKMIDAVQGAEVSGRQEVTYKPRGIEDAPLSELWTNTSRWVRDECFAEDEESDGFRDALIAGMGWIATRMDYSDNADGMPVMHRNDPTEMWWDPAAIKPGLSDRRYDFHAVWMDNRNLKKRWGDDAIGGSDDQPDGVNIIRTGHRYEPNNSDDGENNHIEKSLIWHYQCVEMEPYYRVDDGEGGIIELSPKDYKGMAKQISAFKLNFVKQYKKVYYEAYFCDEDMLEFNLAPCQHGFTRHCITGKRDRNKNQWYGLTRVMKDPQRWANKWLAQIMHIINSNAKGGLLAEVNAFVDPRKAEDEYANPDAITWLKEGGLGKVKEKEMAQYPAGLANLMEFALNSLPQVTGINLEALGLANRDQANVLEQSRKQAAYGLLAPVFDSLRRYRKQQGKVLLYFITEYISDGRLVRVNGPGAAQYVPLTKQPDAVTFDIIVDQSPSAPDVKDRTWRTLMELVPSLIKAGYPLPPDILTYAPLPSDLISKWQQFMMDKQKEASVSPEQVQKMQQEMQKVQEENQKLEQALHDKSQELQLKAEDMEFEHKLKLLELQGQMQLQEQESSNKMQLQDRQSRADLQLKTQSAKGDMKIKAATAGLKPDVSGPIEMSDTDPATMDAIEQISKSVSGAVEQMAAAMKQLAEAQSKPRRVIRDDQGRVSGVQ